MEIAEKMIGAPKARQMSSSVSSVLNLFGNESRCHACVALVCQQSVDEYDDPNRAATAHVRSDPELSR
jgi:hypothetical protein